MIKKAGDWLVSKQVTDTDDPRYGLMTGGMGVMTWRTIYTRMRK